LNGKNSTVFTYGVTGTGKTHTMQGPQNKINEGLIGQSIQELFDVIQVKSSKASFQVIMSYFQIYNEKIKDLLWRDSGQ
jgi:hypothetical protein